VSSEPLQIAYVGLSDVQFANKNPKLHDIDGIAGSISRFGMAAVPVRDDRTGRLVAGHGRIESLRRMKERGDAPPEGVQLGEGGEWLVPVQTGWRSRSDADADAYLVGDNQWTIQSGWDNSQLVELLGGIQEIDPALLQHTGIDSDGLAALVAGIDAANLDALTQAAADEFANADPAKAGKDRSLPIDGIFTMNPITHPIHGISYYSGLKVGIQSKRGQNRDTPNEHVRFPVTFVDNEWHDYDHAVHVDCVKRWKPKYCTTRDVMTQEQCDKAGVEFYPIEQILEWAEELSEHAENVMLIPKYPCLDRIPEKYMLGYSVPTSYGGTPLPSEMFKGRRVHLLGGSWKAQRKYLALLGDSVVSIDFNHCSRIAQYGQVVMGDGSQTYVREMGVTDVSNLYMCAIVVSLGHIAYELHKLTGGLSGLAGDHEDIELMEGAPDER
jgi:hypothetical protein